MVVLRPAMLGAGAHRDPVLPSYRGTTTGQRSSSTPGPLPHLYVQGRGALRRELTACLRTGRTLRVPRARSRGRGKSHVTPEILISQRPAEAADRAVPGHWGGGLILGLGSSALRTLA